MEGGAEDAFQESWDEEIGVEVGRPNASFLVDDRAKGVDWSGVLSVKRLSGLDDETGANEVERCDGDGGECVRDSREEEEWCRSR